MEPIALHDGRIISVHEEDACLGPNCCIHNPSQHPLNTAPLDWHQGIGMMRKCEHGYAHPDPDDMDFKIRTQNWIMVEAVYSVHLMQENCDGCCHSEPCS